MISKELLSKVLGVDILIDIHEDDLTENNILIYWKFTGVANDCKNINIYELAHRCKEWAYSLGFNLTSQYQYAYKVSTVVPKAYVFIDNRKFTSREIITAPSEVEAIFKACRWILNNKENNDKTHTN